MAGSGWRAPARTPRRTSGCSTPSRRARGSTRPATTCGAGSRSSRTCPEPGRTSRGGPRTATTMGIPSPWSTTARSGPRRCVGTTRPVADPTAALVRLPDVQIWRSLDEIPGDLGRTAVVIGNFDGVHLGHQHVVREARRVADTEGLRVVAVTFDPHPMAVLRPEHAPPSLTGLETRAALLETAGVDDVLAVPFDRDVASWTPQEFAERVLADALHAAVVVVGANFRYGAKASGDVTTLTASGDALGFRAVGVPLDGGPQVWSSTYVRLCLATGDVAGAAEALGRPFAVRGIVVRGDQRGRELGFPTANVPTRDLTAAPADGVYAGWLRRLDTGERYPAAISVGTNPTFDGERERRVESYVLDRDDLELYDVEVEVSFVDRIRGMVRFDGVDALVATMHDDVRKAREILGVTDATSPA